MWLAFSAYALGVGDGGTGLNHAVMPARITGQVRA
jgi:hypothetical protein